MGLSDTEVGKDGQVPCTTGQGALEVLLQGVRCACGANQCRQPHSGQGRGHPLPEGTHTCHLLLYYSVPPLCCSLWGCASVTMLSCSQTMSSPWGPRPRETSGASVPHSQPPGDSTWHHTTCVRTPLPASITHSMSVGDPGEGCPNAVVGGKGGLCGVGGRELGLSGLSGVRGFMLYIALS